MCQQQDVGDHQRSDSPPARSAAIRCWPLASHSGRGKRRRISETQTETVTSYQVGRSWLERSSPRLPIGAPLFTRSLHRQPVLGGVMSPTLLPASARRRPGGGPWALIPPGSRGHPRTG
jgi:hypothetical protein